MVTKSSPSHENEVPTNVTVDVDEGAIIDERLTEDGIVIEGSFKAVRGASVRILGVSSAASQLDEPTAENPMIAQIIEDRIIGRGYSRFSDSLRTIMNFDIPIAEIVKNLKLLIKRGLSIPPYIRDTMSTTAVGLSLDIDDLAFKIGGDSDYSYVMTDLLQYIFHRDGSFIRLLNDQLDDFQLLPGNHAFKLIILTKILRSQNVNLSAKFDSLADPTEDNEVCLEVVGAFLIAKVFNAGFEATKYILKLPELIECIENLVATKRNFTLSIKEITSCLKDHENFLKLAIALGERSYVSGADNDTRFQKLVRAFLDLLINNSDKVKHVFRKYEFEQSNAEEIIAQERGVYLMSYDMLNKEGSIVSGISYRIFIRPSLLMIENDTGNKLVYRGEIPHGNLLEAIDDEIQTSFRYDGYTIKMLDLEKVKGFRV